MVTTAQRRKAATPLDGVPNPLRIDPRPVGLPDSPEDALTRLLYHVVPLSVQHYVRDSGGLRNVMDSSAVMAASGLALTHPSSVLAAYVGLGRCLDVVSYGTAPEHKLHVYDYSKLRGRRRNDAPSSSLPSSSSSSSSSYALPTVMVFVHGGAWGSGQPWHYRIMVDKLAQCVDADAGVVVQYPVFPMNSIAEQATSVYDAVGFLRANAAALRLPPRFRVVLAGHSSGANISALALLRSVEEGLDPPLADAFVGLAGVYDVEKHYLFEATRGLHEVSPMGAAAVCRDRFPLASPTKLVPLADPDKVRRHWPPTLLLHGQLDTTVPYTSSKEFADALQSQRCRHVETAFPLRYSHVDPILHMTVADHTSKTATTVRDFYAACARMRQIHCDDYLPSGGGGQLRSKL